MQKGVAGKWYVFAFQDEGGTNPGEPVTGDAANITANLYLDGSGTPNAVDDTNPTELAGGYYVFDITAAEANFDSAVIAPVSATANVNVIGVPGVIYSTPANFTAMGIESDGHVHADLKQWLGAAPAALADTNKVPASIQHDALSLATGAALATVDANVDAILVDTGTTLPASIATIDANVDAILVDTGTTLPGTLTTIAGYIDTEIASIITTLGASGAGLGAIPWNPAWDAEVQSEVNDALVAIHLDHLLAADYDPASKPGVGTALLNEIVESDGGVVRFTANALEQAPTGGSNPNVLADTTIASTTSQTEFTLTAGPNFDDALNDQSVVLYDASNSDFPSIRKIVDYVGSTRTVTIDSAPDFTIVNGDGVRAFVTAPGTTAPTAAQVADAVWDEAAGDHVSAGTFGAKNQNQVPSETIADYRADVSGLATAAALATVDANVDAVLVDTGTTLPASLTSAAAALATVDANVDAILVDTGTTLPGTLSTIAGYIDTEIGTIIANQGTAQADLDIITGTDGVTLATSQANYAPAKAGDQMDLVNAPNSTGLTAIADAILKRDWTAVTGEAGRSMLNALRFLRNKWSISGSTLTVTQEDDTTTAWTATLTADAAADPITGSDPT